LARGLGTEADGRDVEEGMAVYRSQIDREGPVRSDNLGGAFQVLGNAERPAREKPAWVVPQTKAGAARPAPGFALMFVEADS
jgi:hypothetical protein